MRLDHEFAKVASEPLPMEQEDKTEDNPCNSDESLKIVNQVEGLLRNEDSYEQRDAPLNERPYLKAEVREKLFREEVLEKLTLEQYMELWRSGSSSFVSHVTRQGFCDRLASGFGMPSAVGSHRDGFKDVTSSGKKLLPVLAHVWDIRELNQNTVYKFLVDHDVLKKESTAKALEALEDALSGGLANVASYPDQSAFHFAVQDVLDNTYGAEFNNNIFYIFPSDLIASQKHFYFSSKSTFLEGVGKHISNDVFVWEEKFSDSGISVDSGIVFIPKDTPVDPETGSKYILAKDESGNITVEEDKKRINALVTWIEENRGFLEAYHRRIDSLKKRRSTADSEIDSIRRLTFSHFTKTLKNGFGMTQSEAERLLEGIIPFMHSDGNVAGEKLASREEMQGFAQKYSLSYKRPLNTVCSQEYWLSYFDQHPERKPSHVVFYDGDPTNAVQGFLRENGVSARSTEESLLGFDKNHIKDTTKDARAWPGHKELYDKARTIIEEHYS